MNPISNNFDSSSSQSITFKISYLNSYFSKVEDLKQEGRWQKIILLGEQALSDSRATLAQKAAIHTQLASCAFYLGDYSLCCEHAEKSLQVARHLANPDLLMHAHYLLSAERRAQASLSQNPAQQQEMFKEAHQWIERAMAYFEHSDNDHIKAKVLFNGAAAHAEDPKGDLTVAKEWYEEALKLFENLNETDSYNRTALRLARLHLQEDNAENCLKILNAINAHTLTPKTTVHYLLIEARYLTAIENYPKACHVILDAIEKAAQLDMQTDINRLNDLLDEIRSRDVNPLDHLEFKC